jgi:outer membrane protein OmpA-like peptidoglycan-associated protein
LFGICLLQYSSTSQAQNLLANSGFEDINNCTEFHAFCAPEAWFNIPATNILVNNKIAPNPVSGNMVLVLPTGNVMANFNKPRYAYTGFCCALKAKEKYKLSFFIHTAGMPFQHLAVYFTEKEPTLNNVLQQTITQPSVLLTQKNIDSVHSSKWMHVQYEYEATGKERFLLLSAFASSGKTFEMKDAMNRSGDVLCFLDDIAFEGRPVLPTCAEYDANRLSLYAQDSRHNDNIIALPEIQHVKPVVRFKNDTVTIAALLFDVGKYELKPNVKKILDSVIASLSKKGFLKTEISGHTDSRGDQQKNQILSEARAASIQQYIVAQLPQFAGKITTVGKGQNFPVATNDTDAGREKNRRVEIVITYFDIVK